MVVILEAHRTVGKQFFWMARLSREEVAPCHWRENWCFPSEGGWNTSRTCSGRSHHPFSCWYGAHCPSDTLLTTKWMTCCDYTEHVMWMYPTIITSDLTFHLVLKLLQSESSHCVIPLKTWIFIDLAVRTSNHDLFRSLIPVGTK